MPSTFFQRHYREGPTPLSLQRVIFVALLRCPCRTTGDRRRDGRVMNEDHEAGAQHLRSLCATVILASGGSTDYFPFLLASQSHLYSGITAPSPVDREQALHVVVGIFTNLIAITEGPVSERATSILPTSELHPRWTSFRGERCCRVVAGSPAAA